MRRRRNKIEILQAANGNWLEDGEVLKNMEMEYFSDLFRADTRRGGGFMIGAFLN